MAITRQNYVGGKRMDAALKEYDKRKGRAIGGGDSAIIMGAAKWRTRRELALYKRGDIPPQEQTEIMRRGLVMEPIVAEAYFKTTGNIVHTPDKIWAHKSVPHICAQVDGLVGEEGAWEGKTANKWMGDMWGEIGTEDIPDSTYVQVQHGMGVTGRKWCDVTVLIADDDVFATLCYMSESGVDQRMIVNYVCKMDLRTYRIKRNDEFISELYGIVDDFWKLYVVGDELPDDVELMTPRDNVRNANHAEQYALQMLYEAWINKERCEAEYEESVEQVKDMIGTDKGISGDVGRVTWSGASERSKVEWEYLARWLYSKAHSAGVAPDSLEEYMERHTKTYKTKRRFNVPRAWKKDL